MSEGLLGREELPPGDESGGKPSSAWTSGVIEEGSFFSTSLWWTLAYLRTRQGPQHQAVGK